MKPHKYKTFWLYGVMRIDTQLKKTTSMLEKNWHIQSHQLRIWGWLWSNHDSFEPQISDVIKSRRFYIHKICKIRKYPIPETANSIVHATRSKTLIEPSGKVLCQQCVLLYLHTETRAQYRKCFHSVGCPSILFGRKSAVLWHQVI